jgi:siroheme synthase-like protein
MSTNNLYPVFLKLEQMHVLLVGAGNVALEKLESLLGNAPATIVTIVAPFVREEVVAFIKHHPQCNILQRAYEENDLQNKTLVICATDNPVLHAAIKAAANAKGLLVNVADTPALCDFYLGSIVQKGNLKIAISTNGKSPTIAKRIKEVLADAIPDETDALLHNMESIRSTLSGNFAEKIKTLNAITESLAPKK